MVNDKQFIIAKKRYDAKGFSSLKLQDGFILSYQELLKIYCSKGNRQGIIIGLAWQTDPHRQSPQKELDQLLLKETIDPEDVCEMEQTWCGRYALIVENTIYPDAAGLLGIFYSEYALSSSYSILCDVIGIRNKYPDKAFAIGLGFQPGIVTMHKKIKRLLPSQTYHYRQNKLSYRKLFPPSDISKYTNEQIEDVFIQYFKNSLLNMRETVEGEIWLSLTGGHDSRTVMALLEYAGIEYKCFTLEVTNMTNDDRNLPEQLARIANKKFVFLRRFPWNFSSKRMKEYITHSNGFAKDQDAMSYSFGQYQQLPSEGKNITILRGQVWEIFIKYFRNFYDNAGNLNLDGMKKACPQLAGDPYACKSLIRYFKYIGKYKEPQLDDIDRYYWEIRDGCWLSSIEQSCDIMDNITFLQPCNSRYLLAMLMKLAAVESEPWKKFHQERIVQKCCPGLNAIDYDNAQPTQITLKNRIRNIYYMFLSYKYLYGIKNKICNIFRSFLFIMRTNCPKAQIKNKLDKDN